MPENQNEILDIKEAALFLGVNRKTIRNWCERKLIPYFSYPGNRKKFSLTRLSEWRDLQEIRPSNMEAEKARKREEATNKEFKRQLKEARSKLEKHFPKQKER